MTYINIYIYTHITKGLIGAAPDLNLARDPLCFLDIISKQYGPA